MLLGYSLFAVNCWDLPVETKTVEKLVDDRAFDHHPFQIMRAGDRIRTGECQLGRLMPYHLATPACVRILTPTPQAVKQVPNSGIC
jgi:hypothetical protein